MGTPNWSELNSDLLKCVFERLSFISLSRAKLVCSSWYSVLRVCVNNQNQIPWLIILPNVGNKESRCMFFVPENTEKVYRSRDFGVDFAQSYCMTTCGSWLLLLNAIQNLYILNPLTGERIDLPDTQSFNFISTYERACLWIDNKTKDYLVVMMLAGKFTKKEYNNWHNLHLGRCENVFYNEKNQKLYVHINNLDNRVVDIWDFSKDKPHKDRSVSLPCFYINLMDFIYFLEENNISKSGFKSRMAITVSGDFLMITYVKQHKGTMYFRIYKMDSVNNKWVKIDSLGDEALIYDMGITVIANANIPGIKRNSIYYSSSDPKNIFVYDLSKHQKESLPQCVLSSMPSFTKSRWFFPC